MKTLRSYLTDFGSADAQSSAAAITIERISTAAAELAASIADGGNNSSHAQEGQTNVQGETQKLLDVLSHRLFVSAAKASPVNCLLSEEEDEPVPISPEGEIAIAIDPLDGSSNIAINAPIGTIFALYPAVGGDPAAQFLRPGTDIITAGYVIYGPRTELLLSVGSGTFRFVLNGSRSQWNLVGQCVVPVSSNEFAINASNHRHWPEHIGLFVNECLEGQHGKLQSDYNMRWLAALVGETHRILTRGGLFIYPEDKRKGYENGRLRYCYECAPISFLIENAGGTATDGKQRILDITPKTLHARTPFCFGSKNQMALLEASKEYLSSESPLFSNRGFFRTKT